MTASQTARSPIADARAMQIVRTFLEDADPSVTLPELAHRLYLDCHKRRPAGRPPRSRETGYCEDQLIQALIDASKSPDQWSTAHLLDVSDEDAEGTCLVAIDGVRVRVPPWRLNVSTDGTCFVRLPPWRVHLSPGHLVVLIGSFDREATEPIRRFYIGAASPDDAIAAWRSVVEGLCDGHVVAEAKCLTMPDHYPAADAIVIYALASQAQAAQRVAIQASRACARPTETSKFALSVAPGCSSADEPWPDPRRMRRSFGQHRAQALAEAICDCRRNPERPLSDVVHDALVRHRIDPRRMDRNLVT